MFRLLLLYCISIALISIVSSYVPVKGGRHSIKPNEESNTEANHHEVKHDQVIYPLIIENHDLTPKVLNNEKVSFETHNQDQSNKDSNFKSVLEDTNKSAVQEHNHKSTTLNGNREEEIQLNQSKNDTTVSHTENHHIKNEHEEKRIFKEVKENFHHDEVTIRNQVIFKDPASIDHNTHKNVAQNEHKISLNEDQHKVSVSNLDGKNVEHKHNEHFVHISNKDNPSNYHVEQHTSFDGVKIDNQEKVSRDHHSEKIDFKVPVLPGSFDLQTKVGHKDKVNNLGNNHFNVFQEIEHQSNVAASLDNFNKNINVHDTVHKKPDSAFVDISNNNGFKGSLSNKEINSAHHHDDKTSNTHQILVDSKQHENVHSDHVSKIDGFNLYDQKHVSTEEKGHNYEEGSISNTKPTVETSKHKTFLRGAVEEELYYPVPFAGEPHDSFEKHHPMFDSHHHYEGVASFDDKKQTNGHKILINNDQHKVSIGELDNKNVENSHNTHFLQIPNKSDPANHHIEQHSSFDGVVINKQQKCREDVNSAKVDIEVPFLASTLDLQEKNNNDHKPNNHDQNTECTLYAQNHGVSVEENNHNFDSKVIFNKNKDLHNTRNTDISKKEGPLGSVVGGTASDFLNTGSIDKNFNTQKPGYNFHHETELHHHVPFDHGAHDSFEKPHFEHHHPKFEGHHHGHHFHQHKFEDSSEESGLARTSETLFIPEVPTCSSDIVAPTPLTRSEGQQTELKISSHTPHKEKLRSQLKRF
ncbi:hypothetical protein RN001_000683 [Aquatica leii]|uniref:Uncharacterized protein n=1 Tax=Aquatica leii TaxID=1421715 RepID=A0AAN7PF91_9COLE|nr:hypothetical protein RN001_000683 [Aquatica leii]